MGENYTAFMRFPRVRSFSATRDVEGVRQGRIDSGRTLAGSVRGAIASIAARTGLLKGIDCIGNTAIQLQDFVESNRGKDFSHSAFKSRDFDIAADFFHAEAGDRLLHEGGHGAVDFDFETH